MDAGRNVTTAVTTTVKTRPPKRASPTTVGQSYVQLKTPGLALFVRSAGLRRTTDESLSGNEHDRPMAQREVAVGGMLVVMIVTLAGCGGASHKRAATASVPPVSVQVHDALTSALRHSQPRRLPYVAVGECTGPRPGGPGSYRCQTTPRPQRGVREVRVVVRSDGTWSTSPMPVVGVINGHHATVMSGLWGVVHLP